MIPPVVALVHALGLMAWRAARGQPIIPGRPVAGSASRPAPGAENAS